MVNAHRGKKSTYPTYQDKSGEKRREAVATIIDSERP